MKSVQQLLAAEAARIEAALPAGCERVAMDERGREFTSAALSAWLGQRMQDARDLAFIIGGPDGLEPRLKDSASIAMRLSAMTLPHGLARCIPVRHPPDRLPNIECR